MKQSQKLLLTWLAGDTDIFPVIRGLITAEDFTEELYRKVAAEVFRQYEADGRVNPARIVSMFDEEEEQKEIASIFNARIHDVETKSDMDKALRETVIRIKQGSIDYRTKHMDKADLNALMQLVEEKRALERLEKLLP